MGLSISTHLADMLKDVYRGAFFDRPGAGPRFLQGANTFQEKGTAKIFFLGGTSGDWCSDITAFVMAMIHMGEAGPTPSNPLAVVLVGRPYLCGLGEKDIQGGPPNNLVVQDSKLLQEHFAMTLLVLANQILPCHIRGRGFRSTLQYTSRCVLLVDGGILWGGAVRAPPDPDAFIGASPGAQTSQENWSTTNDDPMEMLNSLMQSGNREEGVTRLWYKLATYTGCTISPGMRSRVPREEEEGGKEEEEGQKQKQTEERDLVPFAHFEHRRQECRGAFIRHQLLVSNNKSFLLPMTFLTKRVIDFSSGRDARIKLIVLVPGTRVAAVETFVQSLPPGIRNQITNICQSAPDQMPGSLLPSSCKTTHLLPNTRNRDQEELEHRLLVSRLRLSPREPQRTSGDPGNPIRAILRVHEFFHRGVIRGGVYQRDHAADVEILGKAAVVLLAGPDAEVIAGFRDGPGPWAGGKVVRGGLEPMGRFYALVERLVEGLDHGHATSMI